MSKIQRRYFLVEINPVRYRLRFYYLVAWYKLCIVQIMGNHPQSLKFLMLDSGKYREGKVKKTCESEKILKLNANNLL